MDQRLGKSIKPVDLLQNGAFMNAANAVINGIGQGIQYSMSDGDGTLHSAEEAKTDKKNVGIATSTVTTILTIIQAVMSFL